MDRTNFPGVISQPDKSSFSASGSNNTEYVNDCMKEVCINGASLNTYKKMIDKTYGEGTGFYQKCENFVGEVKASVERKKFSSTSIKNLEYLGKDIYLNGSTITSITEHYVNQFRKEEQDVLKRQQAIRKEQDEKDRKRKEAEEQNRLAEQSRRERELSEKEKEGQVKLWLTIGKWAGIAIVALLLIIYVIIPVVTWILANIVWILIGAAVIGFIIYKANS